MVFKKMSINHKGKPIQLPFEVQKATSVHLYSLFDYDAACSLCENEKFKPIIIKTPEGEKKAGGFVGVIDNQKTTLVPYVEWSLGIFVISKDKETPEIDFVNETSLFFQSFMNDERIGNTVFCPKLILTEKLPTEIGFDHYGIPKELGAIDYSFDSKRVESKVMPENDSWIMKAKLPTKRGIMNKFSLLAAMFKAYGFGTVFRSLKTNVFHATLAGSAEILAKKAHMEVKRDPKTEMFHWDDQDCNCEINPESKWGNILLGLMFKPVLVCCVPNLTFIFSEPVDQ